MAWHVQYKVNLCVMFILTVYLLTSGNFLQELQTSIHILITHQCHISLVISTQGLKRKERPFWHIGVKVWNDMPNEYKNLSKTSFKKETKSSSQYPRNWRFSHGAWWDNAKIQTHQNWTKLNLQFYNVFCTLRNSRISCPLQLNICHFPFFFFFGVYFVFSVMLYFFISILFPV